MAAVGPRHVTPASVAKPVHRVWNEKQLWLILRLLPLTLLALLAACQDPPPQRPVHVMLGPYLLRPGVDPAGDTAVVVHLSRDNGRVKEGRAELRGRHGRPSACW